MESGGRQKEILIWVYKDGKLLRVYCFFVGIYLSKVEVVQIVELVRILVNVSWCKERLDFFGNDGEGYRVL